MSDTYGGFLAIAATDSVAARAGMDIIDKFTVQLDRPIHLNAGDSIQVNQVSGTLSQRYTLDPSMFLQVQVGAVADTQVVVGTEVHPDTITTYNDADSFYKDVQILLTRAITNALESAVTAGVPVATIQIQIAEWATTQNGSMTWIIGTSVVPSEKPSGTIFSYDTAPEIWCVLSTQNSGQVAYTKFTQDSLQVNQCSYYDLEGFNYACNSFPNGVAGSQIDPMSTDLWLGAKFGGLYYDAVLAPSTLTSNDALVPSLSLWGSFRLKGEQDDGDDIIIDGNTIANTNIFGFVHSKDKIFTLSADSTDSNITTLLTSPATATTEWSDTTEFILFGLMMLSATYTDALTKAKTGLTYMDGTDYDHIPGMHPVIIAGHVAGVIDLDLIPDQFSLERVYLKITKHPNLANTYIFAVCLEEAGYNNVQTFNQNFSKIWSWDINLTDSTNDTFIKILQNTFPVVFTSPTDPSEQDPPLGFVVAVECYTGIKQSASDEQFNKLDFGDKDTKTSSGLLSHKGLHYVFDAKTPADYTTDSTNITTYGHNMVFNSVEASGFEAKTVIDNALWLMKPATPIYTASINRSDIQFLSHDAELEIHFTSFPGIEFVEGSNIPMPVRINVNGKSYNHMMHYSKETNYVIKQSLQLSDSMDVIDFSFQPFILYQGSTAYDTDQNSFKLNHIFIRPKVKNLYALGVSHQDNLNNHSTYTSGSMSVSTDAAPVYFNLVIEEALARLLGWDGFTTISSATVSSGVAISPSNGTVTPPFRLPQDRVPINVNKASALYSDMIVCVTQFENLMSLTGTPNAISTFRGMIGNYDPDQTSLPQPEVPFDFDGPMVALDRLEVSVKRGSLNSTVARGSILIGSDFLIQAKINRIGRKKTRLE